MSQAATEILKHNGELIEARLRTLFARENVVPASLREAVQYSLLSGGKRIRPTLVLESFRACAGTEPSRSALSAACAVELIHTFSLVHDDLPAMDDDDLRRGKPTSHKVFGEAMAILAGDALVTMAFECIARDAEPDLVAPLIRELSSAAGPSGMIGGQVLDIESENQSLSLEQLQQIHRMKTGALLATCCRLGAIAARADGQTLFSVTKFGRHMGLAFQIVDDILDVTSTPALLGKATSKDATRGKNTYPALLGLEKSRQEAERQLEMAVAALAPLGARSDSLVTLARFVVSRSN